MDALGVWHVSADTGAALAGGALVVEFRHMGQFIDEQKGPKKPVDIFKFLISGEYDQGDVALVSYDDLHDMVYDEGRRQSIQEALNAALHPHA